MAENIKEKLLASGYLEFHSLGRGTFNEGCFGKWFRKDAAKLYYLIFFVNRWPGCDERWSADCALYLSEDRDSHLTLTQTYVLDVEKTEAFFASAFERLGCVPDIHNQGE